MLSRQHFGHGLLGLPAKFRKQPLRETTIISEFYKLRRTAIKDIAAYLGFLVGFIGAAPFAWGLLAAQLDAGNFARGLWYFFGIVTTAGVFSGIAGLGIGVAAGLLWEQLHRYRRVDRRRNPQLESSAPSVAAVPETMEQRGADTLADSPPRLQLVPESRAMFPNLAGRRVASVRFSAHNIELDFGGLRVVVHGSATLSCGPSSHVYPEPGSRDALCGIIDSRVERIRTVSADRVEVVLDNGCILAIPRAGAAVA